MLLRDVVRDVVAQTAPDELVLVDGLAKFDDAVVTRRLRRQRGSEPLGFGLGEITALVTPAVWLALTEAGKRMGTLTADGAANGLKGLLRKVFRRKSGPVRVPIPTSDQQRVIHQLVRESCQERGIEESTAIDVANAVLARLSLDG